MIINTRLLKESIIGKYRDRVSKILNTLNITENILETVLESVIYARDRIGGESCLSYDSKLIAFICYLIFKRDHIPFDETLFIKESGLSLRELNGLKTVLRNSITYLQKN